MSSYIKEFDVESLNDMIKQLKDTQDIYAKEEEMAACASVIFAWFGAIGGPGGVCATAGVIATFVGWRYDSLSDAISKTIYSAEEYKDILQDSDMKDMIRMEVSTDSVTHEGTEYFYPSDLKVLGIRVNGNWVEIN